MLIFREVERLAPTINKDSSIQFKNFSKDPGADRSFSETVVHFDTKSSIAAP